MKDSNRRDFFKTGAVIAASIASFSAVGGLGTLNAADSSAQQGAQKGAKNISPATLPQRKVGDFTISALGLGCMGMTHGHGEPRDKRAMIRLIHEAIELGITYFDSAEAYIGNEELLAEALKPYRTKVKIGTKFGLYYPFGKQMQDSSKKAILRALDASLKRLNTDYVDIYTRHRVDTDIQMQEVASTIGELIKAGKVRAFGLSEAGAQSIKKAHSVTPVNALQSHYAMSFREVESNEILKTCENLGIAFVAYSPLDRGLLTGKMNENTTFHKTLDMRANFPRYTKENLAKNQAIVKFIANIAKEKNATIAQIALAWLLAQKDFIIPIPETTNPAHLKENLGALKISFSKAELSQIASELKNIPIFGDRYPPNSDAARSVGL
ncbi:aldo/keto reductase [Helicobacter sp. MIT 00-7814]|uniref:aldo/keto reductase n=1 Tax=unclassified Helicobacter TaxID=2593540 RepID=UPI000E1F3F6D|nr:MULTISPECIES: aldo/keto reductase [unclassified Helicobacter]RDU52359.1 aldo/keto reductase [Helicobacter sp. MIT 00-7814]RDU53172.1 aldo/keto reductase [Helicobacter sp. MIT 99-10781]